MKFMLHSPDLEPVLAMQETVLSALLGVVRGKGTESQVGRRGGAGGGREGGGRGYRPKSRINQGRLSLRRLFSRTEDRSWGQKYIDTHVVSRLSELCSNLAILSHAPCVRSVKGSPIESIGVFRRSRLYQSPKRLLPSMHTFVLACISCSRVFRSQPELNHGHCVLSSRMCFFSHPTAKAAPRDIA